MSTIHTYMHTHTHAHICTSFDILDMQECIYMHILNGESHIRTLER